MDSLSFFATVLMYICSAGDVGVAARILPVHFVGHIVGVWHQLAEILTPPKWDGPAILYRQNVEMGDGGHPGGGAV